MSCRLFLHPFSSYSWKAMIAFQEKGIPFEVEMVEKPGVMDELRAHWPVGKFPLLLDGDVPVIEATTIIEYLDLHRPGSVQLVPRDADAALEVRFMDRIFDNHVMTPMQAIVNENIIDALAPDGSRVGRAKAALDAIYGWLEARLGANEWACGDSFTLADCAAAPSLFYADWVHRIPEGCPTLRAYRARLLARPSVSYCVEGARPYRHYFPGGAPDRD